MIKTVNILLFCMIFVTSGALAQFTSVKVNTGQLSIKNFHLQEADSLPNISVNAIIPPRFYINNLGFFCKKELKFEALTGIPFKFRLGSVQYCDRMEGKNNAGFIPAN